MYNTAQPLAFFALEESSAIFTATFADENGSSTIASSVVWSLTDSAGNVINNRLNQAIAGSGSMFSIIIGGLDTKREIAEPLVSNQQVFVRALKFSGSYTSPTSGGPAVITGLYYFGITPVPLE